MKNGDKKDLPKLKTQEWGSSLTQREQNILAISILIYCYLFPIILALSAYCKK